MVQERLWKVKERGAQRNGRSRSSGEAKDAEGAEAEGPNDKGNGNRIQHNTPQTFSILRIHQRQQVTLLYLFVTAMSSMHAIWGSEAQHHHVPDRHRGFAIRQAAVGLTDTRIRFKCTTRDTLAAS